MNERTTIVLGLGASGYSCVRYLAPQERVLAFDTRARPPHLDALRHNFPAVQVLDVSDWRQALNEADRVVVSPGIALNHRLVVEARAADLPLSSDIELFLAAAQAPVVGITGTNGKSTVATLVGKLMASAGCNIGVGGNLGTPALDLLVDSCDAYVLELSSFQLERLAAPNLAVAAILNISADHLDRYADVDGYAASKRRIYIGAERAVFNADDSRTKPTGELPAIALNADDDWRLDGQDVVVNGCRLAGRELALRGGHNRFNVLAAAAIVQAAGIDVAEHLAVLKEFGGLPHRSALVAEVDGTAYIDDSKATNVGACRAALEGFGNGAKNLVLIAGGDAKGASFEALVDPVENHVAHLVLLGRDSDRLDAALRDATVIDRAQTMREAVQLARAAARPGDTVLLSPACASFDMYANFEARGDDFAAEVRVLGKRSASERARWARANSNAPVGAHSDAAP